LSHTDQPSLTETIKPVAHLWEVGVMALVLGIGGFVFNGLGLSYMGVEILIWCLYAMAYNLALGYSGLPSFGHGAFLGVGAYTMAFYQQGVVRQKAECYLVPAWRAEEFADIEGSLTTYGGDSLWVGLLLCILVGACAAGLVALFISHRRGIYLALLTIAFGQMIWFSATKWTDLTRGEDGIQITYQKVNEQSDPDQEKSNRAKRRINQVGLIAGSLDIDSELGSYFFVLGILTLAVVAIRTILHSPFGMIVQAVKQNELRSKFIGYDVRVYKWLSFTLSGALAGLAGGLLAQLQSGAYPEPMSLHRSGQIVMMTVIGGGFVSFWGPIVGVSYFFILRDALGALTPTWPLWFGLSFMAIILFKPEGLMGIWHDVKKKIGGSGW
jgi:branched-chain amino acid transport system permease protein